MTDSLFSAVLEAKRIRAYPPAQEESIRRLSDRLGCPVPVVHGELFRRTNGLLGYDGYYRLFGIDCADRVDLVDWNAPELWKFAWGERLEGFLCFGETAWGDQYAYRLSDLRKDAGSPVYFLEFCEMEPRVIAPDFGTFLRDYLSRTLRVPIDVTIKNVREELGPMGWGDHVAHVPPLLLAPDEAACTVTKLPAIVSLIANGDLYSQVKAQPTEREVKALQPYVDELGRARLRVRWVT